jgi:hypothetical protein
MIASLLNSEPVLICHTNTAIFKAINIRVNGGKLDIPLSKSALPLSGRSVNISSVIKRGSSSEENSSLKLGSGDGFGSVVMGFNLQLFIAVRQYQE